MTSKHIINCPGCFKIFKKAGCYEKHIFDCQRNNDIINPNNKQLYAMITALTEKYNNVQNELDILKTISSGDNVNYSADLIDLSTNLDYSKDKIKAFSDLSLQDISQGSVTIIDSIENNSNSHIINRLKNNNILRFY